jgi:hypothetical protein
MVASTMYRLSFKISAGGAIWGAPDATECELSATEKLSGAPSADCLMIQTSERTAQSLNRALQFRTGAEAARTYGPK